MPTSAAEQALQQWLEKIKASHSDVDIVSAFGPAKSHECINERPALIIATRGIQALQEERGISCLVVAEGLTDATSTKLTEARRTTDEALVHALEMTTSVTVRALTTALILLRTSVDQNVGSKWSWQERYTNICKAPRAYDHLVGMLVQWLIAACKRHPEITDANVQSISMFIYFGEQLGRERSFVLCRGARAADSGEDKEGMRNVVLLSATRTLIGDLLQINGRFATVFRQLNELEATFIADDHHDPLAWLSVVSACTDLLRVLVGDLIGEDGSKDGPKDGPKNSREKVTKNGYYEVAEEVRV
jgi:hypothetical protein